MPPKVPAAKCTRNGGSFLCAAAVAATSALGTGTGGSTSASGEARPADGAASGEPVAPLPLLLREELMTGWSELVARPKLCGGVVASVSCCQVRRNRSICLRRSWSQDRQAQWGAKGGEGGNERDSPTCHVVKREVPCVVRSLRAGKTSGPLSSPLALRQRRPTRLACLPPSRQQQQRQARAGHRRESREEREGTGGGLASTSVPASASAPGIPWWRNPDGTVAAVDLVSATIGTCAQAKSKAGEGAGAGAGPGLMPSFV
jgi:hypothetical protein